jgi:4-hydroxy-3-methylbut-2-enyl diphosphate reductase
LRKEKNRADFFSDFHGQYSKGFNPETDLQKIGVVNQTTMLASDTQEIVDLLRKTMVDFYQLQPNEVVERFADTRDTLCYATNDNQSATYGLLTQEADFAIVAGGYNSSNTSHIVALCEEKLPTYFINSEDKLISNKKVKHFLYESKKEKETSNFIPEKDKVKIMLTCGASCPDPIVEGILRKLISFFPTAQNPDEVVENWLNLN